MQFLLNTRVFHIFFKVTYDSAKIISKVFLHYCQHFQHLLFQSQQCVISVKKLTLNRFHTFSSNTHQLEQVKAG